MLENESILDIPTHQRILKGLAYIPQQPGVFKDMTVKRIFNSGVGPSAKTSSKFVTRLRPITNASPSYVRSVSRLQGNSQVANKEWLR